MNWNTSLLADSSSAILKLFTHSLKESAPQTCQFMVSHIEPSVPAKVVR